MTPATERLDTECSFHDRQAAERCDRFADPSAVRFRDDDYLDHETWIRPAFARLEPLAGMRVLDLGCGHGMASIVLARRGAKVAALDLSFGYIQEAHRRAAANGVRVDFVRGDGERLPFADDRFDRVWGNAILHHLDLNVVIKEIHRILAPGGIGVFCEPWGENPLLSLARRRIAYSGKARTPDETPLRRGDLQLLRGRFASVEVEGFQLLSMARRVLPHGPVVAALDWCDDLLLKRVPFLQQYCRYVVLTLRK